MPYHDPDATDPMTLHGVVVETEDGGPMREMAECFVEEYLRSGFDARRVLWMFKTRGFAGPFLAYCTLGEDTIRKIIDERMFPGKECGSQAGPRLGADQDVAISLPVVDS